MNVQEELKELKQRIYELEQLSKQEREFPQLGNTYYCIDQNGRIARTKWDEATFDLEVRELGNVFRTKEDAEFAVEKLKVEAELRKFSTKYKPYTELYRLAFHSNSEKIIDVVANQSFQDITFHFADRDVAMEAVKSIGEHRIKKYIFGVEG